MSSLRNAVQRRNHKERAQPHSRQKWGILEKHKDYALRAQDHNVKKRKIQDLRVKAAERNDDEFYFGMLSTQSKQGQKVGDRGNRSLGHTEAVGFKRQDAVYLRSMLQVVRREIEKLEDEVQLPEGGEEGSNIVTLRRKSHRDSHGSHMVFVNDEEHQGDFDVKDWFGADEEGLWRGFNRPRKMVPVAQTDDEDTSQLQLTSRKKQLAMEEETRAAKRDEKKRVHAQETRKRRLELLHSQEKELLEAEQQLELQRAHMSGAATKGISKKGQVFKIRERKR